MAQDRLLLVRTAMKKLGLLGEIVVLTDEASTELQALASEYAYELAAALRPHFEETSDEVYRVAADLADRREGGLSVPHLIDSIAWVRLAVAGHVIEADRADRAAARSQATEATVKSIAAAIKLQMARPLIPARRAALEVLVEQLSSAMAAAGRDEGAQAIQSLRESLLWMQADQAYLRILRTILERAAEGGDAS